jgi:DNA polymerase elongation subunit (family B)
MKKLVIDIETVGVPWEQHDPYVREYLIKGMSEAEAEEEKRRGALSPFTGQIVAIGVVNAETKRSCALYAVPGQNELLTKRDGNRTLISGSERLILSKFWDFMGKDDRFISFNGRQFDGPFLMIRSAIHGIVPRRDLVGYRYRFHPNCDLREALNFSGTINPRQMRFNLDLACKAFGVTSSKADGMDGRSVETRFRAGRYEDIALYCLDDVRATCELYLKLEPTILMFETNFREAEEKMARRRVPEEQESLPMMPSSELSFMAALEQGSLELTSSLERVEEPEEKVVVTSKHQALLLEKLTRVEASPEEDIPEGI